MKKLTVTIGIPAYNEKLNIKSLLTSLLKQKTDNILLTEIIVVSDASNDGTNSEVLAFKDRRIKLLINPERQGVNFSQNKIIKTATGDILVLLNADVLPFNTRFLQEIIKPLVKDKNVGLVGAETLPTKPGGTIDCIISDSHKFKNYIYRQINNGQNIYLCHGRTRAFSRSFYTKIRWPKDCPEDSYSYLFCIKNGFKFAYTPSAKVLFRSPATLADHVKQSQRFVKGKEALGRYFSADILKREYRISTFLLFKSLVEFFVKSPLSVMGYLIISIYTRLLALNKNIDHSKWEISLSTKQGLQ